MTSRTYVGELLVIAVVLLVGLANATAEIEPLSSLSATSGIQFFVAGQNSDNIVRFDSSTGRSTVVAKLAAGSRPWSIAVNQAGEIFVGLRGNKKNIVRLVPGRTGDADGPLVAVDLTGTIGRFGPGLMAFDRRGLLNVAGDTHRVVQRYDVKTGELVESMRLRAANLVGLTLAGDSVFAAEYFQKTILRFDLTADPPRGEKFIYKSGHLDRAHGMTVGHNRNLFVSNLKNSLVQEFNGDTGKFVKTFLDVRTIGGGSVKDLHFEPRVGHYFLSSGSVVYELSTDAALLAKHQSNALSGAVAIAVIPAAGQIADNLRLRDKLREVEARVTEKDGPRKVKPQLTDQPVTIRAPQGRFRGWYLGRNAHAKHELIANSKASHNLVLTNGPSSGMAWKLTKSKQGYLITADQGRPYEGFYLSFDPNSKVERIGDRNCSRNLVLIRRLTPEAYWKLTEVDGGYLLQSQAGKFANWYLDADSQARKAGSGHSSSNLVLSQQRPPAGSCWQIEPQPPSGLRRYPPIVAAYLTTLGARLNCHFTIEIYRNSPAYLRNIEPPRTDIGTVEELVQELRKTLKGFEVIRNRNSPLVIHLVEKGLSEREDYPLVKKVDLVYSGVVANVSSEVEKQMPQFGSLRGGGFPSDFYNDYVTKVTIDAKQQPLREILTNCVSRDMYHWIIWIASTDKSAPRVGPATTVKFAGPRVSWSQL